MLDEHITWNEHIKTIGKSLLKISASCTKRECYLTRNHFKTIYFSCIHSYLNYANITWPSTYFTKLKPIHYQQKHTARIASGEDRLTHSRPYDHSML